MTNTVQKGEDHFLFARVHNIGCADPGKVDVTYWVRRSNGTDPEIKVAIDDISSLPVGASSIIHTPWPVGADFANEDYFLIAELSAADDPSAAGVPAVGDNNKAQIKITFVP